MDFLIGTYTHGFGDPSTLGKGIYRVSFDPDAVSFGTPTLAIGLENASALTIDRAGRVVYSVREVFRDRHPGVSAFRLEPDGRLSPIGRLDFAGELPCHLAFDPTNRRLASAQYWTGEVTVFDADDRLCELARLERSGTGPNATRQEGPHAHCVQFTDKGDVLHLADLGADCIVSHRLASDGKNIETSSLSLPSGAGPRHFVINKAETRAYVICELTEYLAVLHRDGLGWRLQEAVPAFDCPADAEGSAAAIRLSPDERFIYVSGRRQSRIVCFSVDGVLTRIGDYSTGGNCPREFILTSDGGWAICANQESGTLCAKKRDDGAGHLEEVAATCDVPAPVALLQL
ncbi:lactonase family protein [Flavimaricola marinus]|uniref:6-phosphogluconolactonase n=1 Tax=Flavimaricola marinus TaxID=1819565 RepID=A0A238LLL1_9RHOB|nr:lactonase family protein [Flavimaricola marinus]SMY09740.1 6-phosphogluconolactonase [Flavimaricola marinus]